MCWWKSFAICAGFAVLSLCWTGLARGEAILHLEHAKGNEAKGNSFAVRTALVRDEREFEHFAAYLLAGKRADVRFPIVEDKEKVVHPPIQWNDKHAKKINVKGLNNAPKPPRHVPPLDVVAPPPAVVPVVMPASATELPASVPAPKALWAGLGMMALLAGWRLAQHRAARA